MVAKSTKVGPFDLVVFGEQATLPTESCTRRYWIATKAGSSPIRRASLEFHADRSMPRVSQFGARIFFPIQKRRRRLGRGDRSLPATARLCRGGRFERRGLGRSWRPLATTNAPAPSTPRPARTSSDRSRADCARPGWRRRKRGSSSKSRSAGTGQALRRSTTRLARCSSSRIFTASTIISGKSWCRTSWRCVSPTRCSSRCGTTPTLTTSRSPSRRRSASVGAAPITISPARCAIWCKTTCCNCCAW